MGNEEENDRYSHDLTPLSRTCSSIQKIRQNLERGYIMSSANGVRVAMWVRPWQEEVGS